MGKLLRHPLLRNAVAERVLLVGYCARTNAHFQKCHGDAPDNLTAIWLNLLDQKFLGDCAPNLIICGLFGPGLTRDEGDAVTIIERLRALHYGGHILVIGPALPRPDLVQAELRAFGPGPRLTLICGAD